MRFEYYICVDTIDYDKLIEYFKEHIAKDIKKDANYIVFMDNYRDTEIVMAVFEKVSEDRNYISEYKIIEAINIDKYWDFEQGFMPEEY